MTTLCVRGLESGALALLKARADREGVSVNTLMLKLIRQELERDQAPHARQRFTDLDELRGSWNAAEAAEFDAAVAPCRQVDKTLWK